ncbi:MAG TPA: hypothetical protein VG944_11960 [Fimbriimonas sp.]|nr:hypothetical protein [Fimbriimonas sp.]
MGFFVWLTFSFVLLVFVLPWILMGIATYREKKERSEPKEPSA